MIEARRQKAEAKCGVRNSECGVLLRPSFASEFRIPNSELRIRRRGLTLIELLVVIVILGVVTAATIPIVLPALDSRRLREASRLLSTQLAAAQMLAITNGRPAGLMIERLPGDNTGAMDLYLCEVPLPYAGDTVSASNATVQVTTSGPNIIGTVTLPPSESWTGLGLRPGDVIRFNYRGPLYYFTGSAPEYVAPWTNTTTPDAQGNKMLDTSTNTFVILPVNPTDYDTSVSPKQPNYRCFPPVAFSVSGWQNVPFQIFRQPTASGGLLGRSARQAVQLPAGTVVDLFYSGDGTGHFGSSPPLPGGSLIIMFAPTGALQDVYFTSQTPQSASEPVHLLVGKREKLTGTAAAVADHNLYDLESIWVSVNPQTGLTTSAEMAAIPGVSYGGGGFVVQQPNYVPDARKFATSAQGMGGR